MSTIVEDLAELNNKNQELKFELYEVEASLGHGIVDNPNVSVDEELKSEYFLIQNDLDRKNEALDLLHEIQKKIYDSEAEIAKEKKTVFESEKKLESLLVDLGANLYNNYDSNLASTFGIHYAEANQEIKEIEDLNAQKEILKQEMENQGFFSKLMTQTKVAGINMSLASHSKKKEEALRKGAKICLDNEVITKENGGEIYGDCVNLKNIVEGGNNRIKLLTEEISGSKEKLLEIENEKKLDQQITDLIKKLKDIASQIGHTYAKQYVTRDAEILVDFPEENKAALEKVLKIKSDLKIVHRNCEILQLSGKIEAAEKDIEHISAEIKENKTKIEEIKEKNKNLAKNLTEVEETMASLKEKRAALEEEAKQDIK